VTEAHLECDRLLSKTGVLQLHKKTGLASYLPTYLHTTYPPTHTPNRVTE